MNDATKNVAGSADSASAQGQNELDAMLAVANKDASLIITGNGDVLEPEHGLIGIGSKIEKVAER